MGSSTSMIIPHFGACTKREWAYGRVGEQLQRCEVRASDFSRSGRGRAGTSTTRRRWRACAHGGARQAERSDWQSFASRHHWRSALGGAVTARHFIAYGDCQSFEMPFARLAQSGAAHTGRRRDRAASRWGHPRTTHGQAGQRGCWRRGACYEPGRGKKPRLHGKGHL